MPEKEEKQPLPEQISPTRIALEQLLLSMEQRDASCQTATATTSLAAALVMISARFEDLISELRQMRAIHAKSLP